MAQINLGDTPNLEKNDEQVAHDTQTTILSARKRDARSVFSNKAFSQRRAETTLSQSVPMSPRAQQKKLTEGNLEIFRANQSEVNSKAAALDAVSSINSRVVQERLKKFT